MKPRDIYAVEIGQRQSLQAFGDRSFHRVREGLPLTGHAVDTVPRNSSPSRALRAQCRAAAEHERIAPRPMADDYGLVPFAPCASLQLRTVLSQRPWADASNQDRAPRRIHTGDGRARGRIVQIRFEMVRVLSIRRHQRQRRDGMFRGGPATRPRVYERARRPLLVYYDGTICLLIYIILDGFVRL